MCLPLHLKLWFFYLYPCYFLQELCSFNKIMRIGRNPHHHLSTLHVSPTKPPSKYQRNLHLSEFTEPFHDMSHGARREAGSQDLEEGTKYGDSRKTWGVCRSEAQVRQRERGNLDASSLLHPRSVHCSYPQNFRALRDCSMHSKVRPLFLCRPPAPRTRGKESSHHILPQPCGWPLTPSQ